MKTAATFLCIFLLPFSTFATSPTLESSETATTQEVEFQQIIQNIIYENVNPLVKVPKEKCKIIIIDSNFKTIREESVEKIEDVCSQSTLVPIIYRSEFITRIHNVSYFMLQKK